MHLSSEYKCPVPEDISYFQEVCGSDYVITATDELVPYGRDYTEDLLFVPAVVLRPANTSEVSAILKYCNGRLIPVTTRGAGTGLSGGALPVMGGVVLAMDRFNKILQIDEANLQATVEPGVINEHFQQAVASVGLFYPPDPASKGSCFLGGNIAHSSGGPKALKYGTTRDYVLNLQVVLADGSVIETGAPVLKNSTGYNLTQLMVGSEGTLGVVTSITFRLLPLPKADFLMLAKFQSVRDACAMVSRIFHAGYQPSACELMTRSAFEAGKDYIQVNFDLEDEVHSVLLIELDGMDRERVHEDGYKLAEFLLLEGASDVLVFDSAEQKEHIWKIRRSIGEAAKKNNIYKEEDTVVPRAHLPELLETVSALESQWGFRTITYGHAGDGNVHINILKDQLEDAYWEHEIPKAIEALFRKVHELGGTISGEHGIGWVQKRYVPIALAGENLKLMRGIRKVFDPNGILNPGKISDQLYVED